MMPSHFLLKIRRRKNILKVDSPDYPLDIKKDKVQQNDKYIKNMANRQAYFFYYIKSEDFELLQYLKLI